MPGLFRSLFGIFLMLVAQMGTAQVAPSAAAIAPEQLAIFKSVLPTDAKLTQATHQKFWSYFKNRSPLEIAEFRQTLQSLLATDMGRQRGMWLSMRDTVASGKKTVHPDYTQANEQLRQKIVALGGSPAKLDTEIAGFADQLENVAAGKPLARGGQELVIDMPLISTVLQGMDGSYRRAEKLIDPKWHP